MLRSLIIFFLGFTSIVNAQMLTDLELKNISVMFNPTYIKNNNITEITGYTSIKKQLKPIVDKQVYNRYKFDKQGRLIQLTETFKTSSTSIDSLITQYVYSNGNMREKIILDAYGQHAYLFSYNDKNDISKMEYRKINDIEQNNILVLEEQYLYEHINDSTILKWYLNQYGKKYQKEIYTYNSLNYLLSVEKRMVFGGGFSMQIYTYDTQGRLIEYKEEGGGTIQKTTYSYDKFSNILEKDYFKNDKHILHDEFLYDSKTSLLKAQLSKEIETNTIYITKFEVVFR